MKQYIVKYHLEGEVELDIDSDVENIEEEALKQIHAGEIGIVRIVEIDSIFDVEEGLEDDDN